MNQIKSILFFVYLSTVCFSLLEPPCAQAHPLKKPYSELADSKQEESTANNAVDDSSLARVFLNACMKQAMRLKNGARTAAKKLIPCVSVDSSSVSSDLDSSSNSGQDLSLDSELNDVNPPVDKTNTRTPDNIMVTDLGVEQKASYLLSGMLRRDIERQDEHLASDVIATAHKLNTFTGNETVPNYDDTLKLVREIMLSGHKNTLVHRLFRMQCEALKDNPDVPSLIQQYQSIPEDLTQFNPGGEMVGSFGAKLEKALQESSKQGLFSDLIPDQAFFQAMYDGLDHKAPKVWSLLSSLFERSDIVAITGLFLEADSIMKDEAITDSAIALQWLALSKLLSDATGVSPLNSLSEALKQVQYAQALNIDIYSSLKAIRNLAWLGYRFSQHIKGASMPYLHIINQIKQPKQNPVKAPAGYMLFDVPADGLCMYHALSQVLNISVGKLIRRMVFRLASIQRRILESIEAQEVWNSHLTPDEANAVFQLTYTATSDGGQLMSEEIHTAILTLQAAHVQITFHSPQGDAAWGSPSMFSLAALAANEENPQPQPFILQTTPLGQSTPEWTLLAPSGAQTPIEMPSGSHPIIILTNSNDSGSNASHYMFAQPIPPSTPAIDIPSSIESPEFEDEHPGSVEDLIQHLSINDTTTVPSIHFIPPQEEVLIFRPIPGAYSRCAGPHPCIRW